MGTSGSSHFRVVLVVCALVAGAPTAADPIPLKARPVVLDPGDTGRTVVGGLHFQGGLVLSSPDVRFGGLSALLVSPDGSRLTALSDHGFRLDAGLVHDRRGNLAGIRDATLVPLTDTDGQRLKSKKKRDAESLARDGKDGIVVAFERHHRLWRYGAGAGPRPLAAPPGLEDAPSNGGIEALTRLRDGRLLAITEGLRRAGAGVGWLGGEPAWSTLSYATRDGFSPTGVTTLPNGDVVMLERRYSVLDGIAIRVLRVAHPTIAPGTRLEGILVAEIAPPLSVDNFEGIAARRGAGGETLLYMVSDDNYSPLQRTLLMMFALRR